MKKILLILTILALSISMLGGCGGGSEQAPPEEDKKAEAPAEEKKEEPPAATEKEEPPVEEEEEEMLSEIAVTILNTSGYTFYSLFISSIEESEWGDDQLGDTVISDEESYEVLLPAYESDLYDIRVVDEEDDEYFFSEVLLEEGCEIDIYFDGGEVVAAGTYTDGGSSHTVGTLESADDGGSDETSSTWIEMRMFNKTDWDFHEVYIYEADASDYGYNHVASEMLYSGGDVKIGVDYYDYYDVQIIDADSDTWFFEDVSLQEGCRIGVYLSSTPQLFVSFPGGYTEEHNGEVY